MYLIRKRFYLRIIHCPDPLGRGKLINIINGFSHSLFHIANVGLKPETRKAFFIPLLKHRAMDLWTI